MPSVAFAYCFTECHFAECRNAERFYAECHYAECYYAECHYAECHYAECRGAVLVHRSCAKCHILVDFCQMLLQLNPLQLFEPKLFRFGTIKIVKLTPVACIINILQS